MSFAEDTLSKLKLPENIEAEAVLLGAMLIDNSIVDTIADRLTQDSFFEPNHGRIFKAIVERVAQGKPATPVSLRPYFEADEGLKALGGVTYLARLTGDPFCHILNVNSTCSDLAGYADRRKIIVGLLDAMVACSDVESTIDEIVAHADKALDLKGSDPIVQLGAGEAADSLIRSFEAPVHGVKSGSIPDLDHILGPIRPKDLVIMAARPGMGKTAVAISYAMGAARDGHGVLFVSLEMSSDQIAGRMVSNMCFTHGDNSVPYGAITDGRLNDWQMKRVVETGSRMHELPLQIIDTGQLSLGRLNLLVKRHARRFAARGQKLELIVVDYLQLMRAGPKGLSKYEDVSEVSNGLKRIAKDHGVGVLALCQLSREVEKRPDKRPILADLRDSGSIEQDADSVIFLLRQEYYLSQNERDPMDPKRASWEDEMDRARGKIDFIAAKRRNGTTGTATGQFHGAYQAVR